MGDRHVWSCRGADMDLLMIVFTILFFAAAIAYTTACEKLK